MFEIRVKNWMGIWKRVNRQFRTWAEARLIVDKAQETRERIGMQPGEFQILDRRQASEKVVA